MKRGFRRHHNNKGLRQIKTGSYLTNLRKLAKKLKVPFGKKTNEEETNS